MLEQSPYVVMELLPPERQAWLRQQSLNVAEFYRRAAATAASEANRQSPTIAADAPDTGEPVDDPDSGGHADNGKE